MDPLGFGLENYDAIGKWRTMDGKFPVDSSGSLPERQNVLDARGNARRAHQRLPEFSALPHREDSDLRAGARPGALRRAHGSAIEKEVAAEDYGFQTLIYAIVHSSPFLQSAANPQCGGPARRRLPAKSARKPPAAHG